MFACVIGGEVGQRGIEMASRRGLGVGAGIFGKVRCKFLPAPGAREIQPVEVGDLAVAAITDRGGG